MESYILLENIKIFAYHGVLDQEKKEGNLFQLDLKLRVDNVKAFSSDELDDTIDYSKVYKVMKDEMDKPSKLLEHVAYRIVRCLKDSFTQIQSVELKITKIVPPIIGYTGSSSVLLID